MSAPSPVAATEAKSDDSSISFLDDLTLRARSAFGEAADAIDKAVDESPLVASLRVKYAALEKEALEWKNEKAAMLEAFKKEQQAAVTKRVATSLASLIGDLLLMLNLKVKEFLTENDPYMFHFVRDMLRELVDAVWPTVTHEILEFIFKNLSGAKILHGDPPKIFFCAEQNPYDGCCACCSGEADHPKSSSSLSSGSTCCNANPCFGFVAFLRYAWEPYDRSIWRVLRDPVWLFLVIVSTIPKYGIAQLFYFGLFLIMDRGDTHTNLRFIAMFKSTLFISLGILSPLVAAGTLFLCVSTYPSGTPRCEDIAVREELWTLFLFLTQVVLCWVAYVCMACWSEEKGGLYVMLKKEKELREKAKSVQASLLDAMASETVETAYFEARKNGADAHASKRLFALLMFDTIVFLVCAGLILWATFANSLDPQASLLSSSTSNNNMSSTNTVELFTMNKNWKYTMTLYFVKALYGLFNVPWVVLLIPGVSSMFCHASPTAYNRYGNTVPLQGKEQSEEVPWRRDAPGCCDPDPIVNAPPPSAVKNTNMTAEADSTRQAMNPLARTHASAHEQQQLLPHPPSLPTPQRSSGAVFAATHNNNSHNNNNNNNNNNDNNINNDTTNRTSLRGSASLHQPHFSTPSARPAATSYSSSAAAPPPATAAESASAADLPGAVVEAPAMAVMLSPSHSQQPQW